MARWDKLGTRGKVNDRRGLAMKGGGGIGLAGIGLIVVFSLLTGSEIPVADIVSQIETTQVPQSQGVQPEEFQGFDKYEEFASTVLGSNNQMWQKVFTDNNQSYEEPLLVLFRGTTQSGCGVASSKIGPHYCPPDKTIYIDETFFDELQSRFGAQGGDVAEAYVIAHEVGHHVQNILGTSSKVRKEQTKNPRQKNELSIKLELQADCYAGLWANSIKNLGVFEPGEIKEAIDAAAAVGDDHIQEASGYSVDPHKWTHGSSEQRVEWFTRGFNTGKVGDCNTF